MTTIYVIFRFIFEISNLFLWPKKLLEKIKKRLYESTIYNEFCFQERSVHQSSFSTPLI